MGTANQIELRLPAPCRTGSEGDCLQVLDAELSEQVLTRLQRAQNVYMPKCIHIVAVHKLLSSFAYCLAA